MTRDCTPHISMYEPPTASHCATMGPCVAQQPSEKAAADEGHAVLAASSMGTVVRPQVDSVTALPSAKEGPRSIAMMLLPVAATENPAHVNEGRLLMSERRTVMTSVAPLVPLPAMAWKVTPAAWQARMAGGTGSKLAVAERVAVPEAVRDNDPVALGVGDVPCETLAVAVGVAVTGGVPVNEAVRELVPDAVGVTDDEPDDDRVRVGVPLCDAIALAVCDGDGVPVTVAV